jgi:hypothetical protein
VGYSSANIQPLANRQYEDENFEPNIAKDTNNEICNLPLVLVIPQLLQWYVELVLSHFLDNKGCPKLYISNRKNTV